MQSGPINFNTTKAIFRAPHIEVAWRDAAPCCATYLLIICRINAESPPPPHFTFIKYWCSHVNRDIEGKFLFGISCFNFNR